MTDPIIDRLDQIKSRADKATPGPWAHDSDGRGGAGEVFTLAGTCFGGGIAVPGGDGYARGDYHPSADMEFIAHARTDVPRMEAALRAVLGLHVPHEGYNGEVLCSECHDNTGMFWDYPCGTVQAIAGALGVETEGEE